MTVMRTCVVMIIVRANGTLKNLGNLGIFYTDTRGMFRGMLNK